MNNLQQIKLIDLTIQAINNEVANKSLEANQQVAELEAEKLKLQEK